MHAVLTAPSEVSFGRCVCSLALSFTVVPGCRFERLKLKCLMEPIAAKYAEILNMFGAEVDRIQKVRFAYC